MSPLPGSKSKPFIEKVTIEQSIHLIQKPLNASFNIISQLRCMLQHFIPLHILSYFYILSMFLFKRKIYSLKEKKSPVSILNYAEITLKPTRVQTLFLPDLPQQRDLCYFTTTYLLPFQCQNDTIVLESRGTSPETLHWR